MGLSVAEGTKQKTMNIIAEVLGLPPGTIKYARIFARWVTRDNHPGGAFIAPLNCYIEENPTAGQQTPLHHEFGCVLPKSAIDEMSATDDRQVLYKHIEYIIQFQDAQRRQQSDSDFDVGSEQANLDALCDELDIETLLRLESV